MSIPSPQRDCFFIGWRHPKVPCPDLQPAKCASFESRHRHVRNPSARIAVEKVAALPVWRIRERDRWCDLRRAPSHRWDQRISLEPSVEHGYEIRAKQPVPSGIENWPVEIGTGIISERKCSVVRPAKEGSAHADLFSGIVKVQKVLRCGGRPMAKSHHSIEQPDHSFHSSCIFTTSTRATAAGHNVRRLAVAWFRLPRLTKAGYLPRCNRRTTGRKMLGRSRP